MKIFGLFLTLLVCSGLYSHAAQNQLGQPLQQAIPTLTGSPDGIIKAPPGYLILDPDTGNLYKKSTAQQLNTGWFLLSTNAPSTFGSLFPGTNIVFTTNAGTLTISSAASASSGDMIWTNYIVWTNSAGSLKALPVLHFVDLRYVSPDIQNIQAVATPIGGSTGYEYYVLANFPSGAVSKSDYAFIDNGPSALDGSHFITITWDALSGASSYDIYTDERDGTPNSTGFLGNTSATTFVDNGVVPTGPLSRFSILEDALTEFNPAGGIAFSLSSAFRVTSKWQFSANGGAGDMEFQGTIDDGTQKKLVRLAPTAGGVGLGPNYLFNTFDDGDGDADALAWFQRKGTNVATLDLDGTIHAKDFVVTGSAFRPEDTVGASAIFQAHDDDTAGAGGRKTFMTLLNGSIPDLTIAAPSGGTVTLDATTFKAGGTSGITQTNILTIAGVITNQITIRAGIITSWISL